MNKSRDFIIKHIPSKKKVEDDFTTGTTDNRDNNNILAIWDKPKINETSYKNRIEQKPKTVTCDKIEVKQFLRRTSVDNINTMLKNSKNILSKINLNLNSDQDKIKEASTMTKTDEVALEYFNTFKGNNSKGVEEESRNRIEDESSIMTDFSIRLEMIRNASNRTNTDMIDYNFLVKRLRAIDVRVNGLVLIF